MLTMPKPTGWLPDYKLLRGLLTPEECRQVIDASDGLAYPATRISPEGELYIDREFRNCDTSHFEPGHPVYDLIMSKVLSKLAEINENYEFEFFAEPERMVPVINVNRYDAERGGHIGTHKDVGGYEGTENCKLSVSIALNNDYEGGEFSIISGPRHYPLADAQAGDSCIFPSFFLHSVFPVLKGARYTAIIWLRGPRLR